jgi:TBC1 domain family member 20
VLCCQVHRDATQLRCDIDRSFWSLDCAKHWSKKRLHRKRAALSDIITAVLVRNPSYYYFQGFHDIVSVLMLVFHDDVLVFGVLESLCARFFCDYMRKDFTVLSKVMKYVIAPVHYS